MAEPARCPTCFRPFPTSGEGVDLSRHCPRVLGGDTWTIVCLVEGIRRRDAYLHNPGKCAQPRVCTQPEGHDGKCDGASHD